MAATDFKDYYATLGVSKTANADEIKRSYRKLARQYHPDMNPGDKGAEARFKEVSEAYEVLSDPEKRQKYDQFGQYWKQAGAGGTWSPGSAGGGTDFGGFDFSQYSTFDDFINELLGRFGGPGGPSGPAGQTYTYRTTTGRAGRPGGVGGFGGFGDFSNFDEQGVGANTDVESAITLTLSEAFHGVQKRLGLSNEVIDVRIPPGVKPGSRIRIRGKGQINPYTQQRGDLYLVVQIQPHSFFQFEGENLVCEVPITPDEAVLGGPIEVPTPDGTVTLNVPPGIRSGQSLRLRQKGWTKPKGGRGDQLVRVVITPPKELSDQEREYYEKIRASRSFNPRDHLQHAHL